MPGVSNTVKKLTFFVPIFLFCLKGEAFEIDITGFSAHIDRGFHQENSGILLDSNGCFVLNPGIAGKVILTGYESEWGDIDLLWQFGGMLDCRFVPMIFTGPILRFSFHLSEHWSIDLNLALSIMGTLQWGGNFDSGAVLPLIYPSIRYRDEDGRGVSANLAFAPKNSGFIPAAGSNLLFLFGSFVFPSIKPSVALLGLTREEQNLFKRTMDRDGIKVKAFPDVDMLTSRVSDGYSPKMIVVADKEANDNLKVVRNSGGEIIPVVLFDRSLLPLRAYKD